jgi:hypothetical protein
MSSTIRVRSSSNWSPPSTLFRDEQLNDPQRFPWLEGERLTGSFLFGHFHEEHEPDMHAWLEKVKTEG